MKYFKDIHTNTVYAFEADGSQDDLIGENLVGISKEEMEKIVLEKQSMRSTATPQEKLVAFLKSNPDVKSLIYSD
jgi:hypothetical protein